MHMFVYKQWMNVEFVSNLRTDHLFLGKLFWIVVCKVVDGEEKMEGAIGS